MALKKIAKYIGGYKREFIIAVIFVIIETALELSIPFVMSDIIDVGIKNRDIDFILSRGIIMGICAVLALVTGLLYARFSAIASNGFGANLRMAEYEKIQKFSFANLDKFETASMVTRMTTDVTVLQRALQTGLRPIARSPAALVMGVAMSAFLNFRLALVFFVCVPALGTVLYFVLRAVAPMFSRLQRAMDRVNSAIQENLTAIRAVKAFVREDYEEEKFESVNAELMTTSKKTFRLVALNLPAFQFIMYTATVLIMWFGGKLIITGGLQVGELTGVLSYVLQVMNTLMMIANVILQLTRSIASARRVCEILDEEPELKDCQNPVNTVSDGSIEFRNVSFKYSAGAEEYVLSDVNLKIKPGETVGILGGTGAAKTTLVQLIPRLYDVTDGAVYVGGHDVREYDMAALRDAVGIVLQKNVLFSGTVRDNLRWGDKTADDDTLWEACRTACADEFLEKMPNGLDTDLGQGGVNISGGQKQRLCIARTLLKRPKIIIFDDSTSAVDTATEAKIRAGLAKLPDMTKIIIAQRITSVMDTDQIIIIDEGKVHAVGTHETLLKSDPIYQEIYQTQMRGGDEK